MKQDSYAVLRKGAPGLVGCTFQKIAIAIFILLSAPETTFARQVTVRGFVVDGSDGQPMQGTNVVLEGAAQRLLGAVADKDGFYQINSIPAGTYVLRATFIGYTSYVDTLNLGSEALVTIGVELMPSAELLEEVVVGAEAGATRIRAGLQTVRPSDIARIPTPDVNGDLATYLQSLPGVVAVGDRGGQLFIRGGTPAQNLVLLDGIPIYQPFHIIGFFSAFPQDLVSHVDMYAGGFGARYSGRLSSVIDVTMREGNKQFFEGAATLSPFLAGLRVEGPLRKGEASVLISARRSVVERIAGPLLGESLPFRFGDLFVKLQQTDRYNNRCSASALHTYDRGRIDPDDARRDDVFRWTNIVFGGRCLAFPSTSPVLLDINTGVSYVRNEVGSAARPERSSQALQSSTELNLTRYYGDTRLNWGLFVRMSWLGSRLGEQFDNVTRLDDLLFAIGGYLEAVLPVGDRLEVTPGVALTAYASDYPAGLEPRLRLVWRPGGKKGPQEFSAALGLYRQTLAGISDERDAGSAFIAWLPAPVDQKPAKALHALVGWQRQLGPYTRVSLEGYYKRLQRLPVPIWSTIARFTTTLVPAEGDITGGDLRLEFRRGIVYSYLGYGLSRTVYHAAQDNFGVWFGTPIRDYNPPHDRRHQVQVVFGLDFGKLRANIRWQYGSGLPYTQPLGFDELIALRSLTDVRTDYGTTRVLYKQPYGGRLPAYHRLDVSVERTFRLKPGTMTLQAGAINVYDRDNIFYFDLFSVSRVNQLPLIPTLSVKLER